MLATCYTKGKKIKLEQLLTFELSRSEVWSVLSVLHLLCEVGNLRRVPFMYNLWFKTTVSLWKNKKKTTSSKHLSLCYSCIVDGAWDEWTPWSLCSSTCGRGYRDRTRTCKLPKNGGEPCRGPSRQTKFCNIAVCPGKCCASAEQFV